jgi:hypothetical protein
MHAQTPVSAPTVADGRNIAVFWLPNRARTEVAPDRSPVAALFLATVGAPAVTTADGISADWLEGSIVDQGRFAAADGQVTAPQSADCAGTRVDADGAGVYHCTIVFAGARRSVVDVTVTGNGEWKTA